MANTGATSPGTLANDSSIGTRSWSDVNNAAASDDSYAYATGNAGAITNYLKATNFGFSIPTGATINGITVQVEAKHAMQMGGCNFLGVRLVKNGVIQTTNKATGSTTSSDATYTFGSTSDLWSNTWSKSDIENSGFGVVVAFQIYSPILAYVYVDHITISIEYTENTLELAGTSSASVSASGSGSVSSSGNALVGTSSSTVSISGSGSLSYAQWNLAGTSSATVSVSGSGGNNVTYETTSWLAPTLQESNSSVGTRDWFIGLGANDASDDVYALSSGPDR